MELIHSILQNKKVVTLVASHLALVIIAASIFFLVPAVRYSDIVEPDIVDIDPVSFSSLYEKNPDGYVFLDVRPLDAYQKLHASGSKNQPLHTLYHERKNLPKNVKGKEIVLICSGGVASGVAYSYLQHYGFRNIVRIGGGIENWQLSGLPVEGNMVIK